MFNSVLSTPKRHHYLPEAYLAGFARGRSDDSIFYLYDRDDRVVRTQTPRNTAVKARYYTVLNKAGQQSTHVEDGLARIEGLALPVLRKLERRDAINIEERQTFALFVGLLGCRVPQFERGIRETTDELGKKITARAFPSVASVMREMRCQGYSEAEVQASAAEIHRIISDGDYDVRRSKESVVRHMLETARDEGWMFWQMNWLVVHAPPRSSFITTDAPFMLLPPSGWKPAFPHLGVGLLTPGAQKVIPLSQAAALVMLDHGDGLAHVEVSTSYVREANLNLAARCERFIIGRDKVLVEAIAAKLSLIPRQRRKLFRVG